MTASHSLGSRLEVSTVAAWWWRSTQISQMSAVSVASSGWRAKSSIYADIGIDRSMPTSRLCRLSGQALAGYLVVLDYGWVIWSA